MVVSRQKVGQAAGWEQVSGSQTARAFAPLSNHLPNLQEGRRAWWLPGRLTWHGALALPHQLGDLQKDGTATSQGCHEALVRPVCVKL